MLIGHQTNQFSNDRYQRALAENLIKSLGHEEAIDACYDHNWMETLTIILDHKLPKASH